MKYEPPIYKWLKLFSPCIIISLGLLVTAIYCFIENSFAYVLFLVLSLVFGVAGMIVKEMARRNVKTIWTADTIIVVVVGLVLLLF